MMKNTIVTEKQIGKTARENGGTLDGYYPEFQAWSVTDNVTRSSFMVRTPDEIPTRFAEARKARADRIAKEKGERHEKG